MDLVVVRMGYTGRTWRMAVKRFGDAFLLRLEMLHDVVEMLHGVGIEHYSVLQSSGMCVLGLEKGKGGIGED
jgi:hypothetical protein